MFGSNEEIDFFRRLSVEEGNFSAVIERRAERQEKKLVHRVSRRPQVSAFVQIRAGITGRSYS